MFSWSAVKTLPAKQFVVLENLVKNLHPLINFDILGIRWENVKFEQNISKFWRIFLNFWVENAFRPKHLFNLDDLLISSWKIKTFWRFKHHCFFAVFEFKQLSTHEKEFLVCFFFYKISTFYFDLNWYDRRSALME